MNKRVTKKEWRTAVGTAKHEMHMAIDCGPSVWGAHQKVLKLLEENPRLKESKFGRNYLRETATLKDLVGAQESIEAAIETTLKRGLGSASVKYWGS